MKQDRIDKPGMLYISHSTPAERPRMWLTVQATQGGKKYLRKVRILSPYDSPGKFEFLDASPVHSGHTIMTPEQFTQLMELVYKKGIEKILAEGE